MDKVPGIRLLPFQAEMLDKLAFGKKVHEAIEGEVLGPGELSDQEQRDRMGVLGAVVRIVGLDMGDLLRVGRRYAEEEADHRADAYSYVIIDEMVGWDYRDKMRNLSGTFELENKSLFEFLKSPLIPVVFDPEPKGAHARKLQAKYGVPGVREEPSGENRAARRAQKAKKRRDRGDLR